MHAGTVDLPFHRRQGLLGTARVRDVPAMVCGECGCALIHSRLLVHLERIGEDALTAAQELRGTLDRTCELEISFCAAA